MQASGLIGYLVRVSVDPEFRQLAMTDPAASFAGYELGEADRAVLMRRDAAVLELVTRATREQLGLVDVPAVVHGNDARSEATPAAPAGQADEKRSAPPGAPLPEMAVMVRMAPFAEGTAGVDLSVSYVASLQPVPQPAAVDDVPLSAVGAEPAQGIVTGAAAAGGGSVADITIVGLGLAAADHLTPEAKWAIRAANEVLYLDTGLATATVLEGLSPRATALFAESYVEDAPRLTAYDHMTERILDAAADHAPVVFAIHGHPLVAVHAPFAVARAAADRGLTVRVLPGISALDAILADLGIDPVVHGLQMYEATDLLLRRRTLHADVPAVIWQVGNLESRLHTSRPNAAKRFERFRDHLLRFYPADHSVTIYYAPPHPLVPVQILVVALADLPAQAPDLHAGVTLYIPPALARPIVDTELLALIDDPDHLRDITR